MNPAAPFLEILSTRVRRNYRGGALLDRWNREGEGRDGDQPEDWIASTIEARNQGLPVIEGEGITRVRVPDGVESNLGDVLANDPIHFLGPEHVCKHGVQLGFLAKFLDSAMRLHLQAHPTAAFAQKFLGSRYGKLEAYVILGARPGISPYIFLGFQRAPVREEWRRIIVEQDLDAMLSCFDPIGVCPGEVWLVPGGLPHAIGEGLLMLEVMEPSDWVVRCEFARQGITLPAAGRFMGRDIDFCLPIFDYNSYTPDDIRRKCRLVPRPVPHSEVEEEELVGACDTGCFNISRLYVHTRTKLPYCGQVRLAIVVSGNGALLAKGATASMLGGKSFLLPAQGDFHAVPSHGQQLEIILCRPTSPAADCRSNLFK